MIHQQAVVVIVVIMSSCRRHRTGCAAVHHVYSTAWNFFQGGVEADHFIQLSSWQKELSRGTQWSASTSFLVCWFGGYHSQDSFNGNKKSFFYRDIMAVIDKSNKFCDIPGYKVWGQTSTKATEATSIRLYLGAKSSWHVGFHDTNTRQIWRN